MLTSRRDLIKAAAATGALLPLGGVGRVAFAQGGRRDLLVVVFLRGGCDSLNLVGPANDKHYTEDRIPELRVFDAGDRQGLPLANGLAPGLDFRLHHEAGPLAELYQAQRLAIVHATGLSNGTRSHFVAQDLIERGVATEALETRVTNGWLDRYLAARPAAAQIAAVSATPAVAHALDGYGPAIAVPDLQGGIGVAGGDPARAVLTALYARGNGPLEQSGRQALANLVAVDSRLPRGPDGKVQPYHPDHGATYEDGDLGRGLQAIARIVRMDLGLRVACVDQGGWDTHEGQPGRFNNQVRLLARNLAGFYNDMAAYHDGLTIVTISEFGRRLRANRSQGTDHGHGGLMMVLGEHVRGGRMYGSWPGLDTPQLDHGVDLAVTTDHRRVLGEILPGHLDPATIARIFPDYSWPGPIGILQKQA